MRTAKRRQSAFAVCARVEAGRVGSSEKIASLSPMGFCDSSRLKVSVGYLFRFCCPDDTAVRAQPLQENAKTAEVSRADKIAGVAKRQFPIDEPNAIYRLSE